MEVIWPRVSPSWAQSNPRTKTEGLVALLYKDLQKIAVQSDCRIQVLEHMECMEFMRGEWFSDSTRERKSIFLASWSDMCSSGAISEATAAATQALGQQMKLQQMEVVQSFVKSNNVFSVLPTRFGKSLLQMPPTSVR